MKRTILLPFIALLLPIFNNCSSDAVVIQKLQTEGNTNPIPESIPQTELKQVNYLALGDSYTIGQSVCETCRFPEQLNSSLKKANPNSTFNLQIIARTGWTTANLISAINNENVLPKYDLVTLLIGVNNQYQSQLFSTYEKEFPELINTAIALAKGDKNNLLVISIPDYAYTPFGQNLQNPKKVSDEIDAYNNFAKKYCEEKSILYINITDITRQGILNPVLVATDKLHPSEIAYSLFVERILPKAAIAIQK